MNVLEHVMFLSSIKKPKYKLILEINIISSLVTNRSKGKIDDAM